MAENNTKRGPGHGPGGPRGGFRKPKNLRGTLSKLMGYLGRYKALLVIVVILLFISAACSVAGSYLIKPLINDYILPGDFIGLAKMLCVMAGVYVVGAVCSYGYARIMVHVAQNTVAKLRADLFNKMQKLPLKFFDTHTHGELMSRYTNDIETVSEALNNSFASLISCSLTFVGTVMMMIVLSPILTAITAVMLGVMLLVVKTIGGRSRRYFAAQQKAIGAVNGYIEEMIEGQKVIKVFNHEAAAKAGFTGLNDTYRDAATRAQAYAGAMMPAMGNLSHINYAITCCIGGLLAIRTGDLGGLSAFLQYTKQVSQPITQISQQVNTILSAVAGAERVFEIMEAEPEVDDGKVTLERVKENADGTLSKADYDTGAWAWKKSDGSLVPLRGDVRFQKVDFGYEAGQNVLHHLNMEIREGELATLSGRTGAGKSTVFKLVLGLYAPRRGTVRIQGVDPRSLTGPQRRALYGYVEQRFHPVPGTVRDQITLYDDTVTEGQVRRAAELAGLAEAIGALPQGYDTPCTPDIFSQGQWQLLSIARAVAADPKLLLLDEITANLDAETERAVLRALKRAAADRTVLSISHRVGADTGRLIPIGEES